MAFCVAISSDLEERRRKMENTLELSLEQAGCTASSILSRKNAPLWRNAVKQTLPMTGCFCVLFLIKENFELMILFCARFFLYSKAFSSTWCSLADTPSAGFPCEGVLLFFEHRQTDCFGELKLLLGFRLLPSSTWC